ncbi:MAG: FGGY family carbohydrate kinase, partial [Actinomycetota bacterium]|nr:FGGY family carbohydrate kinase [Actinomycetota bacterium]
MSGPPGVRPTDDHLWVGCDVGTQSAQVVAVTSAGEVVGDGTAGLTSRRDGRRHEQDPDGWWQAVVSASRAALRGIDPDRIQAIAVCATSGSVLLTDRTGRPITASVMYDDARAGDDADRVREAGA